MATDIVTAKKVIICILHFVENTNTVRYIIIVEEILEGEVQKW
jgi:hypothetical protein